MQWSQVAVAFSLVLVTVLGAAAVADPTGAGEEAGPILLELHCRSDGADVRSMEHEYLEQGCWGHLGIHTYFVGQDAVYELKNGTGTAFSVEQQFSPPVEDFSVQSSWPPQILTPMPIETSMDGLQWTEVAQAEYRFVGFTEGGTSLRQEVVFEFQADEGNEFRFLRIRQPLSAGQGLSGYIDASEMTLLVTQVGPAPTPDLSEQENVHKSCLDDIMEAVWLAHPCWYGGINRWDSPSFFHTYPLGNATLERVEGTALFEYWRPEDPGTCCGQSLIGVLDGPVFLQSSTNGENWQELASFDATYGVPLEFSVELDGHDTSFLRLVSDKHPGYWNHPALKHPEAYLVHSELSLSGLMPEN